ATWPNATSGRASPGGGRARSGSSRRSGDGRPMTLLVQLATSLAIFFPAFWLLSGATSRVPHAVRFVLGSLLVFAVAAASIWLDCGPWSLGVVVVAAVLGSLGLRGEGLARLTDALG